MCQIELIPVSLKRSGSQFHIEADLLLIFRSVEEDASLEFTPVLTDGSHRVELPMVLVAGKRRYRAFKRAVWGLGRNLLKSYKIRKVFKAVNPSLTSYSYRVSLKYEGWMAGAAISLSASG